MTENTVEPLTYDQLVRTNEVLRHQLAFAEKQRDEARQALFNLRDELITGVDFSHSSAVRKLNLSREEKDCHRPYHWKTVDES